MGDIDSKPIFEQYVHYYDLYKKQYDKVYSKHWIHSSSSHTILPEQ